MMNESDPEHEVTALDDLRRVRERLDRESGGDIQKHIAQSNRVFEQLREQLGIRVFETPENQKRRNTGS